MSINKTVTVMVLFLEAMLGVFSIMIGKWEIMLGFTAVVSLTLILLGVIKMMEAKKNPPAPAPANPGSEN